MIARTVFRTPGMWPVLMILFLLAYPCQTRPQQAIATGGTTISDNGGSLSVSFGQVAYTTSTGTTGKVMAGVQQPYEISCLGIKTVIQADSLCFQVFPNPSGGLLVLKGEIPPGKRVIWQLTDSRGTIIDSQKITREETALDLSRQTSGLYFLKLVLGNRVVQSFKITKT